MFIYSWRAKFRNVQEIIPLWIISNWSKIIFKNQDQNQSQKSKKRKEKKNDDSDFSLNHKEEIIKDSASDSDCG